MAPSPRTAWREGRGRGEEAAERSEGREETPVGAFDEFLSDRDGLHFFRRLEPEAVERVLEDNPSRRNELDPRVPKTLGFRREHGTVTIELVELVREVGRFPGHGMDPPSEGRVA